MPYMVVAFRDGRIACELASVGAGLNARQASLSARDLREEYPYAVIAILPNRPYPLDGWPWVPTAPRPGSGMNDEAT